MMSIVAVLTAVFEAMLVLMLLSAWKSEDKEKSKPVYALSIIAIAFSILFSNNILNMGLLNLVVIIISVFAISFIFSKNIKTNIFVALVSILIMTVSEIIASFVITGILKINMEQLTQISEYTILGTVISKLFAFAIIKIICIKHKKREASMGILYWFLFIMMFLVTLVSIFIIFKLQYESYSHQMYNLSIISSFGLLFVAVFALFLYENILTKSEAEHREEVFAQQIKMQSKHLDEILVSQTEMRKLRHDLSNHFITLKAYFEEGDSKKGIEYIDSIKSETSVRKKMIDTGNVSLDAIINTKRSIAEKNGIEFVCNIQIPENIFLDPIDVCVIFGNALDNAIEACGRVEKDKKITVSIVYENDSLICKIVNTAVKTENDFLQTGKVDKKNHGFGIGNIKSALDKYKNVCRFEQNENEFVLSFVVFKS